ncbi:hypothetical protein CCH79_00010322, partial [Gambusia affinis]
ALSVYGTEITARLCLVRSPGTDMAVFCLLCAKRFQTQKALQQHMEVHAGMHSYICSHCERPFPSHTTLKRHLRSHTVGVIIYQWEITVATHYANQLRPTYQNHSRNPSMAKSHKNPKSSATSDIT